ncbi:hypothetical protein AVEN_160011-1 [Araneus ventricosus]|uniref:Uncharacterized protein n=1 Tax=Araneus ventricosus TaxID=182803 RepID=A0A4Y2QHT4_ARAVE|nr:hypothetical protein AVEN_252125-1 [Araneus ventricosus]GBN62826.1 hypothetical protein AVEN_160011-1 [Araneus ventricosus]
MEDKQADNDDNSKNGNVSDAEECVLRLQKSLTELEEKSDKMSGINVEESLTADEDLREKYCDKDIVTSKLFTIDELIEDNLSGANLSDADEVIPPFFKRVMDSTEKL